MRHLALSPSRLVAAAAAAAAVTAAAVTATAAPLRATTLSAPTAGSRSIFLVTGNRLTLNVGEVVSGVASGGQVQMLTLGGQSYVLPGWALPYLGRGLDPRLCDVAALAQAESGGRVPVRLSYTGRAPVLPGVTITKAGQGTATGYLTAVGASRFGTALARQYATDNTRGSYGQDGLFADHASLTLATPATPATPAPLTPAPLTRRYTLTVHGTNLAGRPANGGIVTVTNVDDSHLSANPAKDTAVFHHGVATFSLPAGNYWAVGEFALVDHGFDVGRMVVMPQFRVAGDTTIQVDEQAANSEIQMATPRPADVLNTGFGLFRTAARGPVVSVVVLNTPFSGHGDTPLYVSPTHTAPSTGKLVSIAQQQLRSPASVSGVPYQYDLAYQAIGAIPAQRHVVHPGSLATENAAYYSTVARLGAESRIPLFPVQGAADDIGYVSIGEAVTLDVPSTQTVYLSANPELSWQESYYPVRSLIPSGAQNGVPRTFARGARITEDWGAYPLHPAANVVQGVVRRPWTPISASRDGNTLVLYLQAFSDSVPGHAGGGPRYHAYASYVIDQNGKKVAAGKIPQFQGFFGAHAPLNATPSRITFALRTAEPSPVLNPLGTVTRTVWTWRSAPAAGTKPQQPWICGWAGDTCAAQPMMTLGYAVAGMALNDTTGAGAQVVHLSAGHIQLAATPAITGAKVSVSFDGGKTWRPATVTGRGGQYAAAFDAPAGATVTLRTTATDSAGGSITQTITGTYRIAS
ncbi:MAG TPA: hypothetical protein VGH27_32765 [Streptosporangiaceae bacterium]|jgi:hypothetical protein